MKKPERIDFSDIPEKLICKCEHPCVEDQSIVGLGWVCIFCAKYADEAVAVWKREKELLKLVVSRG